MNLCYFQMLKYKLYSHVLPLVATTTQHTKKLVSSKLFQPTSLSGWLQVLTLSMDIFFGLEVAFRVPGLDVPGKKNGFHIFSNPVSRTRINKRPKMEMSHAVHNLLLLILKGYSMDQLTFFVSCASKAISS